jgi:hypothetical protein
MSSTISRIEEQEYVSRVDYRLSRLLRQGLPPTLDTLLSHMQGAPPDLVLRLLRSRANASAVPEESHDASKDRGAHEPHFLGQSAYEPHPLDFDWPFTPECVETISKIAVNSRGKISLLGMPSVYRALLSADVEATLIDRNPLSVPNRSCEFLCFDLCDRGPLPVSGFDVTLMDPPWYPEVLFAWLKHAIDATRRGGTIWFTLWGELTRPLASQERRKLFDLLSQKGKLDIYPGVARYEIPHFEAAWLRASGLPVDRPWRVGDLVRFEKGFSTSTLPFPEIVSRARWHRFTFKGRQLAIKDSSDVSLPQMQPAGDPPSWTLRAISRRDASRNLIDFWVSTNFVAKLTGTQHFLTALSEITTGKINSQNTLSALNLLQESGAIEFENEIKTWRHEDWTSPD